MQGTLNTICLPELLRTIYVDRRSGRLMLKQGDVSKQIYFEFGQIVFAASNQKEDRLGEALVRHGKLTREQLDYHLHNLDRGQHLGRELVEGGALTDRELITYVTFQLIDIIYSLFTWTIGEYEFDEDEQNRALDELKLKFSTSTIILEGIRRIEDFDIIRRGLGDLNRLIAHTASPLLRLQSLTLKPLERRLLDLVGQPIDILRLLIISHEPPMKTLQSLYGLLSVGILQQLDTDDRRSITGKLPILDFINQPLDEDQIQNEIVVLKTRILSQDPRILLGVSAQATLDEVRSEFYKLATKFHPDRFIESPMHVRADVDYIFANLTKRYDQLRERLLTQQSQQAAQQRPAAPMPELRTSPQPPSTPPPHLNRPQPPRQSPPSFYLPNQQELSQSRQNPKYEPPKPSPNLSSQNFAVSQKNQSFQNSEEAATPYPDYQLHKLPQRGPSMKQDGSLDIDAAIRDLLEFLDDRKAPLFVADSLTTLLRTTEPIYIEQTKLVETVVMWARQKSGMLGRPMHEMLLAVLSSIKHAEQARVLQDFDPKLFYGPFIRELASYCPPTEAQDFLSKVASI